MGSSLVNLLFTYGAAALCLGEGDTKMKEAEKLYLLALLCALYAIGVIAAIANAYIPLGGMAKSIGVIAIAIVLVKLGGKFERARH